MTINTIHVANPGNPVEVQQWLDANDVTTVQSAFVALPYFYIVTNP